MFVVQRARDGDEERAGLHSFIGVSRNNFLDPEAFTQNTLTRVTH